MALLLPLSGQQQKLGEAMLNAAELALEDAGNDKLVLLPKDTRGKPDAAAAAASEALDEGAELILGPLLASSVQTVQPVASAVGVNLISFSSDQSVAGDGAFVMGFLPRDQVRRIVQYAVSDGRTRFAILAPDTPYGRLVSDETEAAVADNGVFMSKVAFYDPAAPDVTATVRAFANYDSRTKIEKEAGEGLDFDAVMLPEGGLRLLQVAPLLPFFDIDPGKVLYLGTGLWDSPVVHREPNLVGGVFAAPAPEARQAFTAKYKQVFGSTPPRLATLAYDAAALAALLSGKEGGPDFSQQAITDENGFLGADGLLRFKESGIVERGLAVLRVERAGFLVVSPAQSRFQAALN
ncbi:MAG: penicillin-binding protein activator [Alphaproteobacteria bacterium]|nr:penicillin-binding protein activator [Alphaproteobacteria bacterium]